MLRQASQLETGERSWHHWCSNFGELSIWKELPLPNCPRPHQSRKGLQSSNMVVEGGIFELGTGVSCCAERGRQAQGGDTRGQLARTNQTVRRLYHAMGPGSGEISRVLIGLWKIESGGTWQIVFNMPLIMRCGVHKFTKPFGFFLYPNQLILHFVLQVIYSL